MRMLYTPRSLFITTRIFTCRARRETPTHDSRKHVVSLTGKQCSVIELRDPNTQGTARAREREERDASVVCSQTRALCGARLPGNVKHSKRQRLAAAAPSLRSSAPSPRRDPPSFVLLVRYNCRLLTQSSVSSVHRSLPRRRQARLPTRANICAGRLASRALSGAYRKSLSFLSSIVSAKLSLCYATSCRAPSPAARQHSHHNLRRLTDSRESANAPPPPFQMSRLLPRAASAGSGDARAHSERAAPAGACLHTSAATASAPEKRVFVFYK